MKILYLDCSMGAAGDMLTAALLELLPDPEQFIDRLNALGIPEVTYQKDRVEKCGITGTQVTVQVHGEEEGENRHHSHHDHHHDEHHHHHRHAGLEDITRIVMDLPVSDPVKDDILEVYRLIAQAESEVHGKPVDEIHFHEVGSMDAIADVTAVCMLINELKPEEVVASPVHVGCGQVQCAHGTMPVPAPATALILQDVPIYGGSIQGELCTPTGAALLKHFVTRFGDMPVLRIQKIGYGMGKKDFTAVNCVRAMLGETSVQPEREPEAETILELSCNLDDMTPEAMGFAMEELLQAGALDVFTSPIGMKKSRPGTMLTVLCRENSRKDMLSLLFRHTSTLGVRETVHGRYVLERKEEVLETPYGPVRRKVSSGWGCERSKYEYEDLARIAREQKISLAEAEEKVKACE